MIKLSWKDVFNSNHKTWGMINYAEKEAVSCGYKYFSWNGRIYESGKSNKDIGTFEELGLE